MKEIIKQPFQCTFKFRTEVEKQPIEMDGYT